MAISGLCLREYPHNSYGLKNGTFTYLQSVGSWRSPIDHINKYLSTMDYPSIISTVMYISRKYLASYRDYKCL